MTKAKRFMDSFRLAFLNDIFDNHADMMLAVGLAMIFIVTPLWGVCLKFSGLSFGVILAILAVAFTLLCAVLSKIGPYGVRFNCSKCCGVCKYSGNDKVYDLDYVRPLYKCLDCHSIGELYQV